jgi:pimeloyl-ACP methyl ester carboxylesterase
MRRLCFLLLTTILLAGNTIVASAQQLLTITDSKNRPSTDGAPRFETTDCPFTTFSGNQIECGWLIVPEDHATPDGATIQLAVAILRSKNPQKAPDPLVYLAGGPGGAFVATAPLLTLRFGLGTLLADRDVILVDQRGMGLSQPTVSCIPFESPLEFYQTPFPPPNINERLQTCLDQFKQQNLHIEFYTTPQNAADFEALRTALGYDKINLYGTSWGTRLALTVLRNHPAGIRSVILDSTLPPDQNSMDSYPYAFDRAFSAVERACAADLLCRLAYPDLRNTYETTYQGLKDNPVELVVDGQSIWVTAEKFEQQVAGMLVNKATVALLPGFITGRDTINYRRSGYISPITAPMTLDRPA